MSKKEQQDIEEKMDKKQIALIGIALAVIGAIFLVIFGSKGNYDRVALKINCNGIDLSGTYNKGESFSCKLLDEEYKLKVKTITSEKVVLESSVGLTPVKEDSDLALSILGIEPKHVGDVLSTVGVVANQSIDLSKEYREFEVVKGKQLKLTIQATDVLSSEYLTIEWK